MTRRLLIASAFAVLTAGLVRVDGQAPPPDFDTYRRVVEPAFLKERALLNGPCYVCHTKITSRFRLRPLAKGATAWSEQQSRENFAVVGRLITPGAPLNSELLMRPLAVDAGGSPAHPGGKIWQSTDDPEWRALAAWVGGPIERRSVAPSSGETAISFDTFRDRVQPVFLNKRAGLARCYVCHSQGTPFRLQPLSPGAATWNEEESRKNFEAVRRLVVPGEPTASRLLMMPLAQSAGGDPFHPGGKRWQTQSDPEWQAIAAWVKGR